MTTIVKHNFIYHPDKNQTEIKTDSNIWEGVPANLIPNVMDILNHPTNQERVIKLHLLSPNLFHQKLIAKIIGITSGAVSVIINKYYQSI